MISTAAIYFANGSFVEVARIEGSPEYKSFMRKHEPAGGELAEGIPSVALLRNALCLLPRLPFCKRNPDFVSTQALLRSLQYSVASYLGTSFCFTGIGIPDQTWQYQNDIIQKAIKSIGLRQTPRMVLVANHLDNSKTSGCRSEIPDGRTRAILSIDYSVSGLNVVLFSEDDGIVDIMRRIYNQHLGAGHRGHGHLESVKAALMEVTKPPLGRDFMGTLLTDDIQDLVLYGDAVMDAGFLDILRAVIGSDLVEKASALEPVFAAAMGMAITSYQEMDWMYFNTKPAFGCQWGSSLYDMSSKEL